MLSALALNSVNFSICRFLSVYVFMGTLQSWNTKKWKMTAKFVVYAAFNALIFDIPG